MPRCTLRLFVIVAVGIICAVLIIHSTRIQLEDVSGLSSASHASFKAIEEWHREASLSEKAEGLGNQSMMPLEKECICDSQKKKEDLPPLYIIMPTYPRPEQIAEMTRFTQTLMLVPNVYLLVCEESTKPTEALENYLMESDIPHTYIRVEMPAQYNTLKKKPRGVVNRLAGMDWIRQNAKTGVLYFADDDNTYDIRIFEEMRTTKKVSVFPVGLIANRGVSSPIVRNGKVIGFYDGWIAKRKFPLDMAGFAVNVEFFLSQPNATMPYTPGYEEDGFLRSLHISPQDLEPKAFNCTKIWVWHTQTKKNNPAKVIPLLNSTSNTNLAFLRHAIYTGN